jgi:predicted MFS family arabinose efflux permease
LGHGRAFGINELLDQIGATIGPLIVAYAIWRSGGFSLGFGILIIPALLTLGFLVPATIAGQKVAPQNREATGPALRDARAFRRYAIGGALVAAGYVDFALIAYRFQRDHIVGTAAISIIFAAAMGVAAITAPGFGRLLDRRGNVAVAAALAVTAVATAIAFLGHGIVADAGAALWGVGTVVQDSLLLALISAVITERRGATTFGLYDLIFGIAWFAGSAAAGALLDLSTVALVVFSVALQLCALPFFITRRPALLSS